MNETNNIINKRGEEESMKEKHEIIEPFDPMEETMKKDEDHGSNAGLQPIEGEEITLKLTDIKRDKKFQVRVDINKEAVKRYAGYYRAYKEAKDRGEEAKCKLPPIWVFIVHGQYILLCGHHRVEAALLARLTTIQAFVFHGSETDAYVFAARDNSENAVQMSRGDVRLCLEKAMLLFPDKSPGVVAEMLGCSHSYAAEIANELSASGNLAVPAKRKGKDGKMYPSKRKGTGERKNASKHKDKGKPASIDGLGKSDSNSGEDTLVQPNSNTATAQPMDEDTPEQLNALATEDATGSETIQSDDSEDCVLSATGKIAPAGCVTPFDFEEDTKSRTSTVESEIPTQSYVEKFSNDVAYFKQTIKQRPNDLSQEEGMKVCKEFCKLMEWLRDQYEDTKKMYDTGSKR